MKFKLVLAALGALVVAGPVSAATVYDFETPTAGVPGSGVDQTVTGGSYLDGTFDGVTYAPLVNGAAGDGVIADGSAFGFNAAPQGNQIGFIQINGSFSIDPMGLTVGKTYDLTFMTAARPSGGDTITIADAGGTIGSFTPGSSSFAEESFTFKPTSTSDMITFTGSDPNLVDETTGFDELTVAAVPEPATWAMMLMGVFGAGGAMRLARRRGLVAV
jgi:hypothetical protein